MGLPEQAWRGFALGSTGFTFLLSLLLWDAYDPWIIWLILGAVGLVSVLGMIWMYFRTSPDKAAA